MKSLVFHLLGICLVLSARGQNLVPNPSFEDIVNCPTGFGQIICPLVSPSPFPQTATNWISPLPNSPDYYNACTQDIYASVPNNFYGYKPAHSGNAYAGIVIYSATSVQGPLGYIEYLEARLDSPLRAGQRYLVACYAKPAFYRDSSSTINHMAVQYIPAGFSKAQVLQQSSPLLLLSQVHMYGKDRAFISDTLNWSYASGYYTATGGEEWLVIGTFYNKNPPVSHIFPPGGTPSQTHQGYYMIDDVSITTAPPCDTDIYRHDTTLCAYPALPYIMQSSAANAATYLWSSGETARSLITARPGTYWCMATSDCDVVTDTFHVAYFNDTVVTALEIVSCDTVHSFSGRQGASLYRWNTGDTTRVITVNKYGNYVCTSLVNCALYIDEYDVSMREKFPEGGISLGNDTAVCDDALLSIGRTYDFSVRYRWNTGDTTCCITPSAPGTYTLTVSDECYDYSDSIRLGIQRCSRCIFVPGAFTPNKDGLNDQLGVRASCAISSFSWYIYNRWGQLVFSTDDINARWNGLYNADLAPVGTYYYYIRYTTPAKPGVQMLKGDITLLR